MSFFILVQQQLVLAVLTTVTTSKCQISRTRQAGRDKKFKTYIKIQLQSNDYYQVLSRKKKLFFIAEDTSRYSSTANCYRVSKNRIHHYDSLYAKLGQKHISEEDVERMLRIISVCLVTSWGYVHANEAKKVKLIAKTRWANTAQTRLPIMLLRGPP